MGKKKNKQDRLRKPTKQESESDKDEEQNISAKLKGDLIHAGDKHEEEL